MERLPMRIWRCFVNFLKCVWFCFCFCFWFLFKKRKNSDPNVSEETEPLLDESRNSFPDSIVNNVPDDITNLTSMEEGRFEQNSIPSSSEENKNPQSAVKVIYAHETKKSRSLEKEFVNQNSDPVSTSTKNFQQTNADISKQLEAENSSIVKTDPSEQVDNSNNSSLNKINNENGSLSKESYKTTKYIKNQDNQISYNAQLGCHSNNEATNFTPAPKEELGGPNSKEPNQSSEIKSDRTVLQITDHCSPEQEISLTANQKQEGKIEENKEKGQKQDMLHGIKKENGNNVTNENITIATDERQAGKIGEDEEKGQDKNEENQKDMSENQEDAVAKKKEATENQISDNNERDTNQTIEKIQNDANRSHYPHKNQNISSYPNLRRDQDLIKTESGYDTKSEVNKLTQIRTEEINNDNWDQFSNQKSINKHQNTQQNQELKSWVVSTFTNPKEDCGFKENSSGNRSAGNAKKQNEEFRELKTENSIVYNSNTSKEDANSLADIIFTTATKKNHSLQNSSQNDNLEVGSEDKTFNTSVSPQNEEIYAKPSKCDAETTLQSREGFVDPSKQNVSTTENNIPEICLQETNNGNKNNVEVAGDSCVLIKKQESYPNEREVNHQDLGETQNEMKQPVLVESYYNSHAEYSSMHYYAIDCSKDNDEARLSSQPEIIEEEPKDKPFQILDVYEKFRDLDLKNIDNSVESIDVINKFARKFEERVNSFKDEKYSLEYFVLDEKLMSLIEKLDKIKCNNDPKAAKKKIGVIEYINRLHSILDSNAS